MTIYISFIALTNLVLDLADLVTIIKQTTTPLHPITKLFKGRIPTLWLLRISKEELDWHYNQTDSVYEWKGWEEFKFWNIINWSQQSSPVKQKNAILPKYFSALSQTLHLKLKKTHKFSSISSSFRNQRTLLLFNWHMLLSVIHLC